MEWNNVFATLHPTFYFRPPPPGPPLLEKEGNKQLVQLLTAGPGSIINRGAPGMAQKDYKYKCKQKYKVLYGRSLLIDIAVFVKKSGSWNSRPILFFWKILDTAAMKMGPLTLLPLLKNQFSIQLNRNTQYVL